MSSIVRDHSDHVQLFRDSLGVKGEYRRTLKKVVTIMMDKDYADDRKFLNCLLKNIVILETMEQCKEYDSQMICTALARKLSGNIRLILFIMILCCLGIHVKYCQGPQ